MKYSTIMCIRNHPLAGFFFVAALALLASTAPASAQQGGSDGGLGGGFGHTWTIPEPVGQTLIVPGLSTNFDNGNRDNVPILSKLPYIQRLFRNMDVGIADRNLMIFITPRIIIQDGSD